VAISVAGVGELTCHGDHQLEVVDANMVPLLWQRTNNIEKMNTLELLYGTTVACCRIRRTRAKVVGTSLETPPSFRSPADVPCMAICGRLNLTYTISSCSFDWACGERSRTLP
jgi:hypothetical protein